MWLGSVASRIGPAMVLGCVVGCGSSRGAHDDAPGVAGAASLDPCAPVGDVPVPCPGRGVFDAPATVELRVADPTAAIYYTLDGSEPTEASGTPYAGPFRVEAADQQGVVILEAKSVHPDQTWSATAVHSYVFPAHVVHQPETPPGVPAIWGVLGNTRTGDYEMDPEVVGSAPSPVEQALRELLTLSVVTDHDALWSTATGIYMNPDATGMAWERGASMELFRPGERPGLQVVGGLRIQGGTSTELWKAAKLSLRVAFRSQYGLDKLRAPLFADSTVAQFNTLVLDAHLNLTWIHPDPDQQVHAQYVRDAYVAKLQNLLGWPAPHSLFVHLYLNGLYWGVYDVHERPDAAFAADYLGGTRAEYDVLRHNAADIVAGDGVAYQDLLGRVRRDLSVEANYQAVAQVLDIDAFIDYLLVNFYVGNTDWPRQNWYAARRRVADGRWYFFPWDAELVLVDVNQDSFGVDDVASPGEIYQALLANPGFATALGARARELASAGNILYVGGSQNRPAAIYLDLRAQIEHAIVAESARWGDNRREPPYTVDDFQAETDRLMQDYFPARTAVFLSQLPPGS